MSAPLHVADERKTSSGLSGAGRPAVSVVLLATDRLDELEGALGRTAPLCRAMGAEQLVVMNCGGGVPADLEQAHPEVRFFLAPQDVGEGQLRSLAVLEASGDIVSIRRAADVADARWLDPLFRAATGRELAGLADVIAPEVADPAAAAVRRSARPSLDVVSAGGAPNAA